MNFDSFRKLCLSLPHATEDVQWGDDLLFRIAGKIFASYNLNPRQATGLRSNAHLNALPSCSKSKAQNVHPTSAVMGGFL